MFADTGSASACIPQYHHAAERLHDFTVGIDVAADTWEREVRPQAEAPDAIKQTVLARLRELGFLLVARGLSVRVDANHWCLTIINNAA
jgi:hypothetical protein